MSPTKITTKPLVIMSNGLLMDHSRNTIGMDLIVIFYFLFFLLLPTNGMGHIFFLLVFGMQYGMGLHSPCNFISHVECL